MQEEFYIGWQEKASYKTGRQVRIAAGLLLAIVAVMAFAIGEAQQTVATSFFEWGKVKEFNGLFLSSPYPHLRVARPGLQGTNDAFSTYLLVHPFKFGLDREMSARFDGDQVRLQGTLIYREGQTMIEVLPDSIAAKPVSSAQPSIGTIPLGRQTIRGEIVDSKCYLGVMNPGQFIAHRACAIRCISGGIPPLLIARGEDGSTRHFLLISPDGRMLNRSLLHIVAEPVEVTGLVERQSGLLLLRADPEAFRRIHHSVR